MRNWSSRGWYGVAGLAGALVLAVLLLGSTLARAQPGVPGRLSRFYSAPAAAGMVVPLAGGGAGVAVPAATNPPAAAPGGTGAAAAPVPAGTDPALPYGVPVIRGDSIITKDYAAHGGLRPPPGNNQGAVDFAFWHNKDAFGAAVVATHSGRVKLLTGDAAYGNLVYVLGPRWSTTYGHLQAFKVHEGDLVVRGQVLGEMGSTGHSTGPHVDYQVWETGANRNPMDYCHCGARGPDTPAQ